MSSPQYTFDTLFLKVKVMSSPQYTFDTLFLKVKDVVFLIFNRLPQQSIINCELVLAAIYDPL